MRKQNIITTLIAVFFGLYTMLATNRGYSAQTASPDAAKDSTDVVMKKAIEGNAAAQNLLGKWYFTGTKTLQKSHTEALRWWTQAADNGNAKAIASMAQCYQYGYGIAIDSLKAAKLYEAAIQKGNTEVLPMHDSIANTNGSIFSCLLLQECYTKGIGVNRNAATGVKWMEKAAKAGHVASQYSIALRHLNNNEADKAAVWFETAAKQNHTGAIYYCAFLQFNGMGVKQDKAAAIELYKEVASRKFLMADVRLAQAYYEGNGTERNDSLAFVHAQRGAAGGYEDALWILGQCYLYGYGTKQDYYLATQNLIDAAIKPAYSGKMKTFINDSKNADLRRYLIGLKQYYVEKDFNAAFETFKQVAKNNIAEGYTMQAMCLANAGYAKQDEKKAVKMLEQQLTKSPVAAYYLSNMYQNGNGCKQNNEKALDLLRAASEAGIAYAQCKLGDRYMDGTGVDTDLTQAARLYLAAEAQRRLAPESALRLIECYQKKIDILPDLDNSEKRIERLSHQQVNGNLIAYLRTIQY